MRDANGTLHHLILGFEDWAACTDARRCETLRARWEASPPRLGDFAWDAESHEIRLREQIVHFHAAPLDNPPTLDQRRGASSDIFGNWYWIDESRRALLVYSSGDASTTRFWPPEHDACAAPLPGDAFAPAARAMLAPPLELAGLAVTTSHYLVVGTVAPAGLLVFDLHAGGEPERVLWPAGVPFAPWDMAAMPDGGICILDRAHRRYWVLDRALQPVRDEQESESVADPAFAPIDGGDDDPAPAASPALGFPLGIRLDASSPVDLADPIAIEALPDCTVLILEDGAGDFARIHRYRFTHRVGAPVSTEVLRDEMEEDARAGFTLRPHDFAFVPAHEEDGLALPDRIFVASAGGNQSFAFDLLLDGAFSAEDAPLRLRPVADFLPMRLFGGKGLVTGPASGGAAGAGYAVYYDFAERWAPLVAQRRPRFAEYGLLVTQPFDGRTPGCVWHRLVFDGCLPPDAAIRIESRASDDRAALEADGAPWQPEPVPLRRATGSELPWARKPSGAHRGSWELLFQRARGQYLQLRLTLAGNRRVSPSMHALRIWYPRFSYLDHYMPAAYRQDEASASFLDRFLAGIEGALTSIEDRIAAVQLLFDAASAPPETLDWLANWYGIALDPAWDEPRRRLFLTHAMEFFQWRGTLRGLTLALRLTLEAHLDPHLFDRDAPPARTGVRIVERFRTRTVSPAALGDPTTPGSALFANDDFSLAAPEARWTPAQGAATLHQRYRDFAGQPGDLTLVYPLTSPPAQAQWQAFSKATLGFVPGAPSARLDLWQGYLQRRHLRIESLNDAWALPNIARFASFDAVPLPAALPADGPALADWYQFESFLLPMRRTAHRFSVLAPVSRCDLDESEEQRRSRLELARRVVTLEKPAHTVFDVRFYLALFQIGAARLGEDTLLDQGSRAPELLREFVLGRDHLVEGFLA